MNEQDLDYELRRAGYKDVFFACHLSLLKNALKSYGFKTVDDIDIDSVAHDFTPYFEPSEFVEDTLSHYEIMDKYGTYEPEVTWQDIEKDADFKDYKFHYEDDGCGISETIDKESMPA